MPESRHKIDIEAVQNRFERTCSSIHVFILHAGRTPDNLRLLASNALDIVTCGSVVSPDSPWIAPALCLASRAGGALFAVAAAESYPVEVEVTDGPPLSYDRSPDSSLIHPIRWLESFAIASLCRDYESIGWLYQVTDEMLRASSTRCPEYTYLFADAICGFLEGAPDTGKRLLAAMDATDPDRQDVTMPDWTLNIDVPKIEMFYRFATGDIEGFNPALERAVAGHYNYWKRNYGKDPNVSRNPDGFLALWPLGMAALALDRNMPVSVESEYCPLSLVQSSGSFSTVLPTG